MQITINLEDGPETMMALHLAQELRADDLANFFNLLLVQAIEKHPDYRMCSSADCVTMIYPACTTTPKKYVHNRNILSHSVTTSPVECCPECGAKTIALEEAFDMPELGTDEKYATYMRPMLAAERLRRTLK